MIRLATLSAVLFASLSATAIVPGLLHGTITDAESAEPIPGVIIQALDSSNKPVGFASSSNNGVFNLRVTDAVDSVSFRCMGYRPLKLPVTYDFSTGITMTPGVTVLNDVIVHAPDIYARGDTLVFNVERFANAKDNAIIDVIKRLPGIKVEDDGTIKYQGKPINKFYIDGNDFIGGQYGLATENISHKDVKSVEVMENHQPIKALEGIDFPEEAGINLKLKDDAQGRWVGVAQVSTGAEPFLYDASLFTMRLAPKFQNVFTLRGGNIGWNPASMITEHDFNDMFSSDCAESLWIEYISADIVSAPLTEKRTRDNLSMVADAINAWKRGDASMRLKLNYMGDRLDYFTGLSTDYLSESIPDFIQHSALRTQTHDLSAQFNTQINKRGYFLKDKFTVNSMWNETNSAVTGTSDLTQAVSRKNLSVVNDLKLVKRTEKHLFELVSRNSFIHSPDCLALSGSENVIQNIGTTDLRSSTETQFGKLSRFWKFYLSGGIDLNYHRMDAQLSGLGTFDNSGIHSAFLSNVYIAPRATYERNGWFVSMKVATKWIHYSINGNHNYIDLTPRMTVRKRTSAKSELSASVFYRSEAPWAYTNIDVPIMTDYRNIFIGKNFDRYSHNVSASAGFRYRNPINSFFINVSAGYNHRRSATMSNILFLDDYIVSSSADRISDSDTWHLNIGTSKGIGHSKMVAGIEVDALTSSASSMRDNAVTPCSQFYIGLNVYFKGSIMRSLSMNYEAKYDFSQMKVNMLSSLYHSFNHNLYITFIPDERLHFTFGAEHFLSRFSAVNMRNLVLIDASATWIISGRTRLSLTANNLLDKESYEYISFGTLSRTEHFFRIRPRNIYASIQYRF